MYNHLVASLLFLSAGVVVGWGPAATAQPITEQYGQVQIVLPTGDRDGGRQAFLDLNCTACHSVAGETGFPEPVGPDQGPRLDAALSLRPAGYLSTAIIAPSHSISIEISNELKSRMAGGLSPMVDYSDVMTVRQLVDLLAYLESIRE